MNYLIIRNDGIGDLIVSTPLIKAIKEIDIEATIYLICSNRNIEYGEMLLSDGFVHFVLNENEYKSRFYSFCKIIAKLFSVRFESIYILKSSYFNLLISIFLKKTKIHSIIAKNLSKNKKIRYTPSFKLSKLILETYEIVDASKNFENNTSIHMSDHFFSLLKDSTSKEPNIPNYYEPQVSSMFVNKIKEYFLNIDNFEKILIFHLDEKWNYAKFSNDEFIELFKNIHESFKGLIFITNGIKINKYEDILIRELKFNQEIDFGGVKSNITVKASSELNGSYFIDNLKIQELFALVKISSIVIEYHGALTHISSIYNTPLIDLIDYNKKNFFNKWKAKSDKNCQIDVNNDNEIILNLKKFLEFD